MNELHLFAGAGGGILGGMLLRHRTVCAVEIEPYCRQVLLQRQRDEILPWFPIWDDIQTFDGEPWRGIADIVCGGFPCQDISAAGKGAGLEGKRSGLWGEMARVVSDVRPRYVFVENSPVLTIRGLGTVLRDLASMGYDAKWCVLGAEALGFPHKRERIWIVAHAHGLRLEAYRDTRSSREIQEIRSSVETYGTDPKLWLQSTSSKYHRSNDGYTNRVDRFKAIGNGQVPAVAAAAWRILNGDLRKREGKK